MTPDPAAPAQPIADPDPAAAGAGSPAQAGQAPPAGPAQPGGQGPDSQRGGDDARSYADTARQIAGKDIAGRDHEQRQRTETTARAELSHSTFNAPVYVASNFGLGFGQGATRLRVSRISAEELTEPFIQTPAIQRIADRITDPALVFLVGQRGHGKAAALVQILRAPTVGTAPMFYLDPSTDLTMFSCADVPEGSVLILQDLPSDAAARLDEHVAKRIEAELLARRCRLGITSERAVRLAASGAGVAVFELDTRAEPGEVFTRHLAALLLGTGVTRAEVRGWPGVAELLTSELGPSCSLSAAKRLAAHLVEARDEPATAARRVRVQMTEYADEAVAQWFRGLDSLKVHCMAISLAVLNGMSRAVIAREAEVLERIILPAPDSPNAPAQPNPLAAGSAISPALLNAITTTEVQQTDNGPIVVQAMRYQEAQYPGRVLRYVWQERDAARAAVVQWLRYLGTAPEVDIRVRSAVAVGVLACEAMDFLHNHVIAAWAASKDPDARDSAAVAVGPPGEDPELRKTVRSLVADWADEDSNWRLRATAARAYGRPIGLDSPSLALRQLARLADTDDVDVMIAVGNSYCELVMEGTTALSLRVLREVERLAADRKRDLQVTGRLTLLGLSWLRGAPQQLSEHEDRLKKWPTLLLLALAREEQAGPAARLWQLSLHDPLVGEMAAGSLDGWAEAAEDDGELRTAVVSFLQWIAEDPRSRRTVARRAQGWAGRNGKAPMTGQSVIAYLG